MERALTLFVRLFPLPYPPVTQIQGKRGGKNRIEVSACSTTFLPFLFLQVPSLTSRHISNLSSQVFEFELLPNLPSDVMIILCRIR